LTVSLKRELVVEVYREIIGVFIEVALTLSHKDLSTSIIFAVLVLALNRNIKPQYLRVVLYATALASLSGHLLRLLRPELASMLSIP
jgi:hypothetical protein